MKKHMLHLSSAIAVLALSAASVHAAVLFDSGATTLTNTDPIELGRIGRDGVISDWSAQKSFPGVFNPGVAYHYHTFTVPDILFPFVQITIDDISGTSLTFAAAYAGSFSPSNLAMNYLGDAGGSGNFFGTDPRAFQVILPGGSDLVLLVNDVSATGAGLGQPYRITVEGFLDTEFHDQVPEPATFPLVAFGSACLLFAVSRRRVHPAGAGS